MKNHYNVIVIGGGMAGSAAAISAAREGANVLLIEKYNCLGGAAAFDLINPFMPYKTKLEDGTKKAVNAGLFTEILERLDAMGGVRAGTEHAPVFEVEYLKKLLNDMARDAGVNLLFGAHLTDVSVLDGRINSVTVSSVSGELDFSADVYIDASGDANLSFLAGAPYRIGRDGDSLCQPMTLCFRLADVDAEKFAKQRAEINPLYKKMKKDGLIKNPREDVLLFKTLSDSIIHFNTTRVVKRNPTDIFDVTESELEARDQVFEMLDFLKSNFTAFENAKLIQTGMQIGARESRMIIGEHVLTKDDITSMTKFPDGIAACNYDIDIHSPDGSGTSHWFFPDGEYYTIPYRALIPKGFCNLLVAGRCISADHDAQASLRVMPPCTSVGEAAGIAAAMAKRGDVKSVDTELLRAKLRERGAVVD
ncbi:MAG: FAD-dependent oxidoreductase [Clostridia bacterium]|nr:FAD-dependent oxidoreductase [Clostridia bacterium]